MDGLSYTQFRNININDPFFDGLKNSYQEFNDWFNKKSINGDSAYILLDEYSRINGFMYIKMETGPIEDVHPPLPQGKYLKIGTFKFNSGGTRRGERFLKKVFDVAIEYGFNYIYLTVFDEHRYLQDFFKKYGFEEVSVKTSLNGTERVLCRSLDASFGSSTNSYPFVQLENHRSFLLSIYPDFHSRMLPDSILNNESHDIIKDISHTNSIHKIYICSMKIAAEFRPGDALLIYRTSDHKGPAHYRSVATSIGVVEEYRSIYSFHSYDEFEKYCSSYSIFTHAELMRIYQEKKYCHIIRFTYNAALKKRVTRGELIETIGINSSYWGAFELSHSQFKSVCRLGEVHESIIID